MTAFETIRAIEEFHEASEIVRLRALVKNLEQDNEMLRLQGSNLRLLLMAQNEKRDYERT